MHEASREAAPAPLSAPSRFDKLWRGALLLSVLLALGTLFLVNMEQREESYETQVARSSTLRYVGAVEAVEGASRPSTTLPPSAVSTFPLPPTPSPAAPSPSSSSSAAPASASPSPSSPAGSASPSSSPPPARGTDYKSTQFKATPFPSDYVSRLARAAEDLGVAIPDVNSRRRQVPNDPGPCPPYDLDEAGTRKPIFPPLEGVSYDAAHAADAPSPPAIRHLTLGLTAVSHNTPETLRATLKNWAASGLLELVDDKVIMLSAPQPEEIQLALEHGFRVYTPSPEETELMKQRSWEYFSQFLPDNAAKIAAFPHAKNVEADPTKPARWASFIGANQVLLNLEQSTDVILFLEKDFVLSETVAGNKASIVRQLLASVALIEEKSAIVRLRRLDDPNRDGLPDCCNGVCGGTFSNFQMKCSYQSHLDWLALACDRANIVDRSHGAIQKCLEEVPSAGVPPDTKNTLQLSPYGAWVEPITSYCFSMDHSGWSNNPLVVRRTWWIQAVGHVGTLANDANSDFEMNAMLICGLAPRYNWGSGASGTGPPMACVLSPGMFVHVEVDGRRRA